jgi:hypothetical protein
VTGVLFGFGVVTFLWLPVAQGAGERGGKSEIRNPKSEGNPKPEVRNQVIYFLSLGAMLACFPATARLGGASAADILAVLTSWGALALGVLVVGNVGLGLRGAFRLLRRLTSPSLQP